MGSICSNAALALLFSTLAPIASADLVDWAAPQDVTSIDEVSTNGTLVGAYNFWNNAAAFDVTVNGITFVPFTPNEWDSGGGSLIATSSTGDADFDQLLTTARTPFGTPSGNPTGFGAMRIDTLVPLQMGQTYEVQMWYCDQRSGQLQDRLMNMSSVTGPVVTTGGIADNLGALNQGTISGALEADPNDMNGPTDTVFGQFVLGYFTRTSNDELWLLVEGSHPVLAQNLRPHVTAMQIRAVDGAPVGSSYCDAVANTTGVPATIAGFGSSVAAQNDLTLIVDNMPALTFGFFITSQLQTFVPNPGGSSGNLCIGGSIGRYVGPGQIQNSGNEGSISLTLDLTQHPQPNGFVTVVAGDTWNWTAWYRDTLPMGGATSNFSNGLEVSFQ